MPNAESRRLEEDARRTANWKRWGPYLSARQWGTVREDYSPDGTNWEYFPHDHARSRAYRWGEDGLLGICDRECRLCFALALWNGRDPILKERLFGLTHTEGNHGEDVKECYFYLDSTPTHAYMKALYKYPQREFPYTALLEENRRRTRNDPEFELVDTAIFHEDRYFDVFAEYAKASPDDLLIRVTIANRGPDTAPLHALPTIWFRNTWSWGRTGDSYWPKPRIADGTVPATLALDHQSLGRWHFAADAAPERSVPEFLFTENETNSKRLFGYPSASPYVKDAFHEYVVRGRDEAVNPLRFGTKAAVHYRLEIPPGRSLTLRLRLCASDQAQDPDFSEWFDRTFDLRKQEADELYSSLATGPLTEEESRVIRHGYAGLLWTKQFYHYVVREWLEGDPPSPLPPESRWEGRNRQWLHLYNRDVISMPDSWEYPWYAAWDLAFHMIAFAKLDPTFAKEQLVLFVREWYMHPNGQLPAYEFELSDVNPPVQAWAAWRVYKMTGERGSRDRTFLERVFQKHLLNFTWWVNREDLEGNNLFAGGFLGLDNIGVFDRSERLRGGNQLEQADGTAWMAFYCLTMLSMALELAMHSAAYEDMASKFFEHFVAVADAINTLGGTGLWDESDGFYYDQLRINGDPISLKIRSMVGIIPLFAVEVLEKRIFEKLPGFKKRLLWFLNNRADLTHHISYMDAAYTEGGTTDRLLAIPSAERLERVLRYVLDENEFLSPYGVRSLSRAHKERPFVLQTGSESHDVEYTPGESSSGLFGGNSNWRGPVWFPLNFLLIDALERYHHFYGDRFQVECPTGSGRRMNLKAVAQELNARLARLFVTGGNGPPPWAGGDRRFADDPHWRDLTLFYEYFHGDNGRGCGASHQTGWTALAVRSVEELARHRRQKQC